MKTINALYEELKNDSKAKKAYLKAVSEKKVAEFLKEHDCDATEAEVKEFLKSKESTNKEITDDELDMVSGGGDCTTYDSWGRPVVFPLNSCYHFTSEDGSTSGNCAECTFSVDTGISLVCKNPQREKSVDDIN